MIDPDRQGKTNTGKKDDPLFSWGNGRISRVVVCCDVMVVVGGGGGVGGVVTGSGTFGGASLTTAGQTPH